MNRKEQHINQILRRWLRGDVKRSEEAELEAAAREDEFLAGAMEGYRQQPADDHAARLAKLRQQLRQQPARRRVGIPLWRVAAAVAILVVALGILWIGTDSSRMGDLAMENQAAPEKEQPAQTKEAPATAAEELAESEEVLPTAPADPPAPSASSPKRTEPGTSAVSGESIAVVDDAALEGVPQVAAKESIQLGAEEAEDALVMDGVPLNTEATEYALEEAESVVVTPAEPQVDLPVTASPAAPPPSPVQGPIYNSRDRMAVSNSGVPVAREGFRLVEGTVKDAEGYPLIGATILQPGTTNGTITDIDGSFLLSVDENSQALQISYTGYETTLVEIADELDIALAEDGATLDEVVVTGYGQARRDSADEDSTLRPFARPVMGLSAYKDYMDQQTALVNGRGKVRLEFQVHADGSIREVEIIRSTNPALNAKAIDLLRNGPQWEIITGEAPVETVYVIRFR